MRRGYVLLIAGGDSVNIGVEECNKYALKIAVDAGAEVFKKLGIVPDILVGDMDSIDHETLEFFRKKGCLVCEYSREKDELDLELAILEALKANPVEIHVYGSWGSRPDQTLAAYRLLKRYSDHSILLMNRDWEVFLLASSSSFNAFPGQIWSFLAACDVVRGLSLKGFKYPLNSYDLHFHETFTLSNEAMNNKVEVIFESGELFVFKERR